MFVRPFIVFSAALVALACSSNSVTQSDPSHAGSGSGGSSSGAAGSTGSGGASGGSATSGAGGGSVGGGHAGLAGGGTDSGGGDAGSGGDAGTGPAPLVAPEGLSVVPHAAGCGSLRLQALTLRPGAEHLEMYVALKNEGDMGVCSPSFTVNLLDANGDPLVTSGGGLDVRGFFRLKDDPTTNAACLEPGGITMGGLTDFPPEVTLEAVSRVEYFCGFWRFDVVPAGDLSIQNVKTVSRDGGVVYTGQLVNGLDLPLTKPGVAVFTLDALGRPLGVSNAVGTDPLAVGDSWDFETELSAEAGVDFAAYPTPTLN
jgi:hypothetical protein